MASIGRTDHSPVQHVGQAHVVNVGQFTRGLAGNVHAGSAAPDQGVVFDGLERRILGNVQLLVFPFYQFGITQCSAVVGEDRAFFDAQRLGLAPKAQCRPLQQMTARSRRSLAQRHG